jgi:hypothetical protein
MEMPSLAGPGYLSQQLPPVGILEIWLPGKKFVVIAQKPKH